MYDLGDVLKQDDGAPATNKIAKNYGTSFAYIDFKYLPQVLGGYLRQAPVSRHQPPHALDVHLC
jgi:hypothetical protein